MRVPLELDNYIIWVEDKDFDLIKGELDALDTLIALFEGDYHVDYYVSQGVVGPIEAIFLFLDARDNGEIQQLMLEFKVDKNLDLTKVNLINYEELIPTSSIEEAFQEFRNLLATFNN